MSTDMERWHVQCSGHFKFQHTVHSIQWENSIQFHYHLWHKTHLVESGNFHSQSSDKPEPSCLLIASPLMHWYTLGQTPGHRSPHWCSGEAQCTSCIGWHETLYRTATASRPTANKKKTLCVSTCGCDCGWPLPNSKPHKLWLHNTVRS